jgi:uncharacterized protein Yka (UPF0111/DUF47 family)
VGMKLSLVPRETRFYDLFESEVALVRETLAVLCDSLVRDSSAHEKLRDLEHRCDDVAREIYSLTNVTFSTPIEAEDILALASGLDDIVDLAEEVSDKIELYKAGPIPDSAKRLGECFAAAGEQLERAVRHIQDGEALQPVLTEIHRLENEGDQITREALSNLFAGGHGTPVDLIKWKDLYDLLEETIDACESAAEVIETISLKPA